MPLAKGEPPLPVLARWDSMYFGDFERSRAARVCDLRDPHLISSTLPTLGTDTDVISMVRAALVVNLKCSHEGIQLHTTVPQTSDCLLTGFDACNLSTATVAV